MIYIARHRSNPPDECSYKRMTIKKQGKPYRMQTIENIRDVVKEQTGYDPYFEPKKRDKNFVTSRQLFLYFVLKYTKIVQRQAGALIKKDHSTVVYAIECVNKFKDNEPCYANVYNAIDLKLQQITKVP